jgi:hypothetical protein
MALEVAERDLETVRSWAIEDGLRKELQVLEHPTPTKPVMREAATTKARVTQSFSTEFEGVPWYGAKGDILLLPRTLCDALRRSHLVEEVDPATALSQATVGR